MTETEYERVYDPHLREAVEEPGITGYMRLMLGLAGTQKLDEATQKGIFWQLIGWLGSEAGARRARPWQYLTIFLLGAVFVLFAALYNLWFMILLGVI